VIISKQVEGWEAATMMRGFPPFLMIYEPYLTQVVVWL
jgi:hypothetical protein